MGEGLRKQGTRGVIAEDQDQLICRCRPDGTLTFVNEAYCRYFGKKREELLGRSFMSLILREDREGVRAHIASIDQANPLRVIEHRVLLPNGEIRWQRWVNVAIFDRDGRPLEFQSVGWDITEQIRAAEALRESEEKYRLLLENASEAIVVAQDGRLVFVNPKTSEIMGYSRGELTSRPFLELIHPDDRAMVAERYARRIRGEDAPVGYSFRLISKAGDIIWVELNAVRITWEGRPATLNFLTPITEWVRAQKTQEVLLRISQAASAAENLEGLLRIIHEQLSTLLDTTNFYIALYDEETGLYSFPYHVDQHDRVEDYAPRQLGRGLTDYVRRTGEPLLADEGKLQELIERGEVELVGTPSRIWIGAPLKTAQGVIGVVALQSYTDASLYSPRDLELLTFVSDNIASVIERKRAEEALREKEYRAQKYLDIAPVIFVALDAEGRVTLINQKGCEILGYEVNEIIGKDWFDHFLPDREREEAKSVFRRLMVGEIEPVEYYENSVLTARGEERLLAWHNTVLRDEAGRIVGTLSSGEDITEQRWGERLLHALNDLSLAMARALTSEEIFSTVIETFRRLGIFAVVHLLNEERTHLTPKYFGYSPQAVEMAEKISGIRAKEIAAPIKDIEICRQVVWEGKTVFVKDTAKAMRRLLPSPLKKLAKQLIKVLGIPRRAIVTPLIVEGRVIGMLGVQSDNLTEGDIPTITAFAHQMSSAAWHKAQLMQELRQSLEELQSTQEQLLQSQKMESVGRLAGGIAHEFNNLLTAINGFAQLLQLELPDSDPRREYVTAIYQAGQRAADLTRRLLAFSRKQIVQPRVLDLNQVVRDMDAMLRRIIGEDIEIEVIPAPDLWPVKVDPAQMEQVIINLAVNARDAMPEGGKLTIETANVVLSEDYVAEHLGAKAGEHVMLAISDTGVGMSEEVQCHLFEPFFTTKEVGQGTGLGLAMVYGIVKQSGGSIWCYSEEGVGTTFKVYLPRALGEKSAAWQAKGGREMYVGSETILLVEDDQTVREFALQVLERMGYTVLEAEDAEKALEWAQRYPAPIHLLLTDVVMPRMSGQKLAERIAAIRPGVKTLYMSGYTDRAIVNHGVLEPGTAFIQKPFTPSALTNKIRQVLAE